MTREEFERLVNEGFALLPEWVRKKISNVAVLIENEPSEEVRREEGLGPGETLLGLYHGIPLTSRDSTYGVGMVLPDTITVYQKPICDEAESRASRDDEIMFKKAVQEAVAETVWHEVAHHFGMDEDEVRLREHERDITKD